MLSLYTPLKELFVRSWLTWLIADQSSMKYIFTWCCCKCREIEPAFSQQHITLLKEHLIWRINCCYYVINEIVVKIDSFTMYCSSLQNVYSIITLFVEYFYNMRVKIEWRQFFPPFSSSISSYSGLQEYRVSQQVWDTLLSCTYPKLGTPCLYVLLSSNFF